MFWVTCSFGVKMMSLCHGWGSQPTQTASHIHIRHKQSVWAHWYAVHGHMAALNSYTYLTWLRFWGSGSLVESKWFPHIMFEADRHLKLYPTYTKCLSILICCPWAYDSSLKQLYPHYLAQVLGLQVTCRVKMMSLCQDWDWQRPWKQLAKQAAVRQTPHRWEGAL